MQAFQLNIADSKKKDKSTEQQKIRRGSQYETLMRKFSEAHKVECNSVSVNIPKVQRGVKQFPTGSTYEGKWDVLGMSGNGTYTFPNGVIYTGDFVDGMFDGEGEMQYPGGEVLKGRFCNGQMVERTLICADGLFYSDEDFMYCQMPDRRFTIEYEEGLNPGGNSYMTAEQPSKDIPPGYYDTGDGFFSPDTKMVYRYDEITAILRSPSEREQKWIVENCRTNPSEEIGPRMDLYEEWLDPEDPPEETPLPACMSKGTEHLFESSELAFLSARDFDTRASRSVSISDYGKWLQLQRLKSLGNFARSKTNISLLNLDPLI